MLIKNNQIIVRKCNQETADKLLKMYEWGDKKNKILTLPFHVFSEEDLFNDLKTQGIKYYAIPLEAKGEGHLYSIITDDCKIESNFRHVSPFLIDEDTHKDFTYMISFIRGLSYYYADNEDRMRVSYFNKILEELCEYSKNPPFAFHEKMGKIANRLNEIFDKYFYEIEGDGRFDSEFIEELEVGGLYFHLMKKVLEPIKNLYEEADLVIWYHVIPSLGTEEN